MTPRRSIKLFHPEFKCDELSAYDGTVTNDRGWILAYDSILAGNEIRPAMKARHEVILTAKFTRRRTALPIGLFSAQRR